MKYGEVVAELGTTRSTASTSSVIGSAEQQAGAICRLLSNVVASSLDLHVKYGGVVPEIAARSHIESITPVIEQAMAESKCGWNQIDAVAVTYGAGLGGSLLIGVLTARTLAIIRNKPLYAVNHVEAHVYANFLTESLKLSPKVDNRHKKGTIYELPKSQPKFPMLALIVSGGHTQLVLFTDHFKYKLLGQTHDDAIGEAFDKVVDKTFLAYKEFKPKSVVIAGGVAASQELRQQLTERISLPLNYTD